MADLFGSRKFWVALVGLLVIVINQFHPFVVDQEALVGFIVIVSGYIIGLALDPGDGTTVSQRFTSMLSSTKFWTALIGSIYMVAEAAGAKLLFDQSTLIYVAVTLSSWIVGKGVADFRAFTANNSVG